MFVCRWNFLLLLVFSIHITNAAKSDMSLPARLRESGDHSEDIGRVKRDASNEEVDFSQPREEYDSEERNFLHELAESAKRANRLLHFGKRPANSMLHFGKRPANSMLHFGKRPANSMLHFGKRPANSMLHFGKRPANSMLHFGKRPANSMLHFGKRPANSMLHFGKRPANSMLHFGKRPANSMLHFGKRPANSMLHFGKRPANSMLHFGKRPANSMLHFGKRSISDEENNDVMKGDSDLKRVAGQIIHFGKRQPEDDDVNEEVDDSSSSNDGLSNVVLHLPFLGYHPAFNTRSLSKDDINDLYDVIYESLMQDDDIEQPEDEEESNSRHGRMVDESKRSYNQNPDLYNRQAKNSIIHFG